MRGHLVIRVIFSVIPNLSKSVTGSPPLFHTVLFKGNESIQRVFLVLFVPLLRSAWMTVQDVVVCLSLCITKASQRFWNRKYPRDGVRSLQSIVLIKQHSGINSEPDNPNLFIKVSL